MKPERQIEKFLRRIDVVPDAERKRLRLEKLLEGRDKTKQPTSADAQPTIRRYIMNRHIWKIAASLVVAATVIGVIGILQNGDQTAYGFDQTVAAMRGKRSFHIQIYEGSPTQRLEEFWAEFDKHGQVIRLRKLEQWKRGDRPAVVLWENQVEHEYEPGDEGQPGVHVISKSRHHEDKGKLEGFDPETTVEKVYKDIENGRSTVAISDSQTLDGYIVVDVTQKGSVMRRVFLVDAETKFVVRTDLYRLDQKDDEGNDRYIRGIEVLEYNQPIDPNLFKPNFPEDTVTIVDQISADENVRQAADGFIQTFAPVEGKRSFHIQTYLKSPTKRQDEFWAEFDEHGKVIRIRQLDYLSRGDGPVEILWENQVEHRYTPGYWGGILVISKTEHHADEEYLERFDLEAIIKGFNKEIENGQAIFTIADSPIQDGYIVVEVTENKSQSMRVLLVDPETKHLVRMDSYSLIEKDDEGNDKYDRGIEVLEYNQPLDPHLFEPHFPADTIIIDQISGPVGMAQGDLSDEDVAYEVARLAMEALATDDYETAGLLFGGAPREYFERRRSVFLKPAADIVVGESRPYKWNGPTFRIPCSYVAEKEGRLTKINWTFWVITGEGQPGRWFIKPTYLDFSVEE